MFEKNTESIGLEIGDGLVKAMYIQSNSHENKLLAYEAVKVNFRDGRQGIVNAMNEVLTKLALKNKKKVKVNISVSGESVMVRDIHWPQMSDPEIRKALKFEVERQVHYKPDEIVFDYYSVLDKGIAETKTRVVLVAAKKDLIENYASLIEATGYPCGFIEVDTFSLLNCFYVNGPKVPAEKTIGIINVGMEVTNIDIIKGKIFGLTKDAFVAWSNLIDALPEGFQLDFNNTTALKGLMGSDDVYELCLFIMNALSNQIRRTIEFYESQGRDTVEEIYLSGKLAIEKNLDKYLQNMLGLKVSLWNPIANIQYAPEVFEKKGLKENALMLGLCVGLACYRAFSINLAPLKKVEKQNKILEFADQYKGLFFILGIVILFLIGLSGIFSGQIKIKEAKKIKLLNENQRLDSVLKEIENLKTGKEKLKEQAGIARALLTHKILWSKTFYSISKNLPKDIWLTEVYIRDYNPEIPDYASQFNMIAKVMSEIEKTQAITIAPKKKVSLFIKGIAYAPENDAMLSAINGFINNLKKSIDFSENFQSIELNRSYGEVLGEAGVMKFEIECALK